MQKTQSVMQEVKKAVVGKDAIIARILMAMLAGGHVLLEDVPGVGKTTVALAFSKAMQLIYQRIQFTPDVMPSDITGYTMYKKDRDANVYMPGAAMCNLLLADEINRASSKTQSALLEVMAEGNVTVDGVTRATPKPFLVIATQNPTGSSGTQALPESQLDRFIVRLSMGYPDQNNEVEMLRRNSGTPTLESIVGVMTPAELMQMQAEVGAIFMSDELCYYLTSLSAWTRGQSGIELGVSPRGSLALMAMARADAYLHGRNYVVPKDIQEVFIPVCAHRIVLSPRARVGGLTEQQILKKALTQVEAPRMVR